MGKVPKVPESFGEIGAGGGYFWKASPVVVRMISQHYIIIFKPILTEIRENIVCIMQKHEPCDQLNQTIYSCICRTRTLCFFHEIVWEVCLVQTRFQNLREISFKMVHFHKKKN